MLPEIDGKLSWDRKRAIKRLVSFSPYKKPKEKKKLKRAIPKPKNKSPFKFP